MHFLFEYHHILTFLESVPFSSLVYCTAASRAQPSESYRKFLAVLDRSYLLSRLSHRPLDFRHPTTGIQHLGHFPHLNPQQQEQTPLIKQNVYTLVDRRSALRGQFGGVWCFWGSWYVHT